MTVEEILAELERIEEKTRECATRSARTQANMEKEGDDARMYAASGRAFAYRQMSGELKALSNKIRTA